MGKEKKRYSAEEKFLILREASEAGVVKTCKKHGVDPTTYYSWKEKYESEGIAGLLAKKSGPRLKEKDLRELKKENQILKKLLAEKEVLIEAQTELIKKKSRGTKKRGLL
jgi:putative transposase